MRNLKVVLVLALVSLTFMGSALASSRAYADTNDRSQSVLKCYYQEDPTTRGCDLALTKEVGVNGSTPVEAETTATELSAKVGDTVTYVVTVSNDSTGKLIPEGTVTVTDTLPSGVTYVSSNPSAGTYDSTTGLWTFDLASNLPATLTITTTANTVGTVENIATLTGYACNSNSTEVAYSDSNSNNNTDQAYVAVSAVPVPAPAPVTPAPVAPVAPKAAAPATPNTGFGVSFKNPASALVILAPAAAFLSIAFAGRRHIAKKLG